MKTKLMSAALLAAAMMSASMSASAQTRKAEFAKGHKMVVRKEIKNDQRRCPKCMEMMRKTKALHFDARMKQARFHDARFRQVRFADARFRQARMKDASQFKSARFDKRSHVRQRHHRR